MHVKFTGPFDYTPSDAMTVTIKYKPGKKHMLVRRECGERAIALGVAVEVQAPGRPQEHRRGRQAQGQGNRSTAGR